jgi:putative transposase
MKTVLVLNALAMALGRQNVNDGELIASMSRKANCYDNAHVESFFHSLKTELVYRRNFKTRKEAKQAIFEWIETWYNRERLHSSLGYMSPKEYEKLALVS